MLMLLIRVIAYAILRDDDLLLPLRYAADAKIFFATFHYALMPPYAAVMARY